MDSNKVYLVQTDTTVGFLSNDPYRLSTTKKRNPNQKILRAVDSFKTLQKFVRVPKQFKKQVRNSKKTTFIYSNGESFRVVDRDNKHQNFLQKHHVLYSTSANITRQEFNEEYAIDKSDIVIFTKDGFSNKTSSKIYKINRIKVKRLR